MWKSAHLKDEETQRNKEPKRFLELEDRIRNMKISGELEVVHLEAVRMRKLKAEVQEPDEVYKNKVKDNKVYKHKVSKDEAKKKNPVSENYHSNFSNKLRANKSGGQVNKPPLKTGLWKLGRKPEGQDSCIMHHKSSPLLGFGYKHNNNPV